MRTTHLDIGCGHAPRNPYGRDDLYGIDIFPLDNKASFTSLVANLALEPIPCEDNFFDSVSAYDFLEHIPRVLPTRDGSSTRAPFVELMNEIHRVLKPGGLFYASTPFFPHDVVFGDPTHVNYLVIDSHSYFTRPLLFAKAYGYRGDFDVIRVEAVKPGLEYIQRRTTMSERIMGRLKENLWLRSKHRTHLLWEFSAKK